MCTWLGAAPKHITKYVAAYQRIAPRARILLIQFNVPTIVSSYAQQRAAIVPAVSTALETLAECFHPPIMNETYSSTKPNEYASHDGNIAASFRPPASHYPRSKNLLHMFPNGRISSASRFLSVLNERLHSPLPLDEMLYDSCPIKGTY